MQQFKQSESTSARRIFYLHLVDALDGITPETGESGGQPQISKNGGSLSSTSDTLNHIGYGLYYITLTATELNTLGTIAIRFKSENTAEFQDIAMVVALDPYSAVSIDNAAIADAVLDEALSGHASAGTLGASVTAIKAKTDNLPSDPADESLLEAAIAAIDLTPVLDAIAALAGSIDFSSVLAAIAALPATLSASHGEGRWDAIGGGGWPVTGESLVWQITEKQELMKNVAAILSLTKKVLESMPGKEVPGLAKMKDRVEDAIALAEKHSEELGRLAGRLMETAAGLKAVSGAVGSVKAGVDGIKTAVDKLHPAEIQLGRGAEDAMLAYSPDQDRDEVGKFEDMGMGHGPGDKNAPLNPRGPYSKTAVKEPAGLEKSTDTEDMNAPYGDWTNYTAEVYTKVDQAARSRMDDSIGIGRSAAESIDEGMDGFMLKSKGAVQGIIAYEIGGDKLDIANVASAPWNMSGSTDPRKESGIGIQLLKGAFEDGLAKNVKQCVLMPIPGAVPFYEKVGFTWAAPAQMSISSEAMTEFIKKVR